MDIVSKRIASSKSKVLQTATQSFVSHVREEHSARSCMITILFPTVSASWQELNSNINKLTKLFRGLPLAYAVLNVNMHGGGKSKNKKCQKRKD